MKIEVNINKSYFFVLLSTLVILAGIIITIAYGGSSPTTMGHSAEEVEGTVPSGFCVFSSTQSSCPAGWTRASQFDNRTIRGSDSGIGQTGGNETHRHWVDLGEDNYARGGTSNDPAHTELWSELASSWPPYVNVTICCKN